MIIGHVRRPTIGAISVAVVALAFIAPAAGAATTHSRTTLRGSNPSWAKKTNRDGALPASRKITARVYLAPQDEAKLDAAVQSVSTPGSASYRKFVSPAAFTAKYGPTKAAVKTVSAWLRQSGLRVTSVAPERRYLTVKGSAAQINKAFATTLSYYRKSGALHRAPSKAPSAPSEIATHILGVTGLADTTAKMKPATAPPPDGFRNATPCSTYYGQIPAKKANDGSALPKFNGKTLAYAPCGYTPPQLRSAYGVTNTGTGRGATVGIIDAYAAPTILSDANTYALRHGGKAFAHGQFTQTLPDEFTLEDECGANGWYGEETLDVEAVHGMAPAAKVHYYAVSSCEDADFNDTVAQVLVDNDVDLVSNSYGVTEGDWAAEPATKLVWDLLMKQAALQGITFNFSSGDNGDELANSGTLQPDATGDSPLVTSVGGTSLGVGKNGARTFETGWGTEKYALSDDGTAWDSVGFLYGSGGGYSTLYPRPWYQNGVVPDNGKGRAQPDVGMVGDPNTGFLIGETQTFPEGVHYDEYRIGGTSLSCPLFSGVEAQAVGKSGRMGLANPAIYALAKNKQSGAYTDITGRHAPAGDVRADFANGLDAADGYLYSVRTFNQDASLFTAKGWDDVTGVGAPTGAFVRALSH